MTTMVKGAESQMVSISAMLLSAASIVPFQTQCEPFRCRRPRGIHRRAPGAQRVSAPRRHLAASHTAALGTRRERGASGAPARGPAAGQTSPRRPVTPVS